MKATLNSKHQPKAAITAIFALLCIIITTIFSGGCSSSEESLETRVEVKVTTAGIESIPQEGSIELYFTVTPADTDFSYANGSYNARLYYATSKSRAFEAYVTEIKPTGNGRYKATITDRNNGEPFQTKVCLGIATNNSSSSIYFSNDFVIQNYEIEAGITTMSFLKSDNPSQFFDDFPRNFSLLGGVFGYLLTI